MPGAQREGDPAAELADQIEIGIRQVIASAVLFNYEVAERTGMNIRDAQVLGLCQLHGPLTAGQVATLAQLPSATVTGVVDRLEALHMVRRTRDAKDRRKVIVEVDDDHLMRTLGPHYVEQSTRLRTVLGSFTVRQQQVIRDFLREIIAAQPGQEPLPR
jgi:DNA-binding MarR family transcriptional regulator